MFGFASTTNNCTYTGDVMEYGHANLSRKVFRPLDEGGDPLWHERRVFSRWEAWEYLFASAAAYAPHKRDGITLERGETMPLSLRFLASRWGWSVKKVRVFLEWLEKDGRVEVRQRTEKGHTYLLVNYGRWNPEGHSKGTARAQQGHKEETTKQRTTTTGAYTSDFEQAWSAYPNRPGDNKREAFRAWTARIRDGADPAEMIAGTERYARFVTANKTEPRFIKRAATFYGPDHHFAESWEAPRKQNGPYNFWNAPLKGEAA